MTIKLLSENSTQLKFLRFKVHKQQDRNIPLLQPFCANDFYHVLMCLFHRNSECYIPRYHLGTTWISLRSPET